MSATIVTIHSVGPDGRDHRLAMPADLPGCRDIDSLWRVSRARLDHAAANRARTGAACAR
jgi:hypothetical protein